MTELERQYHRDICIFDLSPRDLKRVNKILSEIHYEDIRNSLHWMAVCDDYTAQLPKDLLRVLRLYRRGLLPCAAMLIRGLEIDDKKVGPTPTEFSNIVQKSTFREMTFSMIVNLVVGDLFGFNNHVQGARLFHDIFPKEKDSYSQLATGSTDELAWHTEDCYHPFRCDFLTLLCLRNPDKVPTTLSVPNLASLSQKTKEVLRMSRYRILPDQTYSALESEEIRKMPILFGNSQNPFLRMDPLYTQIEEGDLEAKAAYRALVRLIEKSRREVVLEPGDLLIVDNYKAVHGRKSFQARLDGTDRWLKRTFLTASLRKSAFHRESIASPWIKDDTMSSFYESATG